MLYVLFQNDANKGKLPNSCHEYYEAKIAQIPNLKEQAHTPQKPLVSHIYKNKDFYSILT